MALTILAAVGAHGAQADAWSERKCFYYEAAVGDALAALGREGLRAEFLAQNDAFIAAGCVKTHAICPATPQEGRLVDMLTMMTMNEGMASTFVPFGCRGG
ncbi:hypothetical protein NBRC116596_12390 [Litorivita sp. NS0012-18]